MIERRGARRRRTRPVQRQIVDTGRQIEIVGIGCPLNREPQQIHIEPRHGGKIAHMEREVPEAGVRGSREISHDVLQLYLTEH
jgi:hypothetical protein